MLKLIIPCTMLGIASACVYRDQFFLGFLAFFFLVGWFIGGYLVRRKRIIKLDDPFRAFTADELKAIGIRLPNPEQYDCETFIR